MTSNLVLIEYRYLQAWSEEGALTAMVNWYRAAFLQQKLVSNRVRTHPQWFIVIPTVLSLELTIFDLMLKTASGNKWDCITINSHPLG